jgi:hypothetical protein
VAALAAVYQAIGKHAMAGVNFSQWGIVAAPTYLGRSAVAEALQRFADEGAWGISPHTIPHHSLHAISGTISQAFKAHGPNFGIGGGPGAAAEAMMVAATLLSTGDLPGLWLVLTEYEPAQIPTDSARPSLNGCCDAGRAPAEVAQVNGWHANGTHASYVHPDLGTEPICTAVAIALVPTPETSIGFALCLHRAATETEEPSRRFGPPLNHLGPLARALAAATPPWNDLSEQRWRLDSTGWLEIRSLDSGSETEP